METFNKLVPIATDADSCVVTRCPAAQIRYLTSLDDAFRVRSTRVDPPHIGQVNVDFFTTGMCTPPDVSRNRPQTPPAAGRQHSEPSAVRPIEVA